MRVHSLMALNSALAWMGLLTAEIHAGLLTIEQATDISKKTGRPILAVAGSAR